MRLRRASDLGVVVADDLSDSDIRLLAVDLSERAIEMGKRDGSLGVIDAIFSEELTELMKSAIAEAAIQLEERRTTLTAEKSRIDATLVELRADLAAIVSPSSTETVQSNSRSQVIQGRIAKAVAKGAVVAAQLDAVQKGLDLRTVALTAQFAAIEKQYHGSYRAARVTVTQRSAQGLRHVSWFRRWYTPWRSAPREVGRYVGVGGTKSDVRPEQTEDVGGISK